MRKFFTLILTLVASVGTMLAQDPAVGDTIEYNGVKYKLTATTEVNVIKQAYTGENLVIPANFDYGGKNYVVKEIATSAFNGNTSIKSADIAARIIGGSAFRECSNLETMTLQEGVLEINEYFGSGSKLKTLHLPASLLVIKGFYSPFVLNELESITVAEGNTQFKVGADGAVYSKNGTKLYGFPYKYAKPFAEVPEGVTEIFDRAFFRCKNLADTLTLPSTLATASEVFYGGNAKCVILNASNYSVRSCFGESSQLEEVIIGKTCAKIGQLMFNNCYAINKVTVLAETMPVWEYGTNTGWPSFSLDFTKAKLYVHCGQSATYAADVNKWGKFSNIVDTLLYDVTLVGEHGTVTRANTAVCNEITVTVSNIESDCEFINWSNGATTTSTTFSVTSDTTITANIKKNLNIGDMFTAKTVEGIEVGYKVLTKEAGNMTVQIGNGSRAAIDKEAAGPITIPAKAVYFDEEYDVVAVGISAFNSCKQITKAVVPAPVKSIGVNAFRSCELLEEVSLPEGLEEIGMFGFSYCNKLTTITLPSTLTTLGNFAFCECKSLKSMVIPNGVGYIGNSLFKSCKELEEVTLPKGSLYVDYAAFSSCEKLATIHNIETVKYYGMAALDYTPHLQNLYNTNTVNYITYADPDRKIAMIEGPGYSNNVTDLVFPEGVTVVGAYSGFSYNSKLQTVEMPSTVEAVGERTFYQCPELKTCTLKAEVPPIIFSYENVSRQNLVASRIFEGTTPTDVKVYVPKSAFDKYAKGSWKWVTLRPIGGWTVEFKDHNGNNIVAPQQVEQGDKPAIIPTEVDTWYSYDYMYVFANAWDTAVVNVGDTIYTARYTQEALPEYKVYFYATQAEAEAATTDGLGFSKVKHGHAVEAAAVEQMTAAVPAKECEKVNGWLGGDLTNVTSVLRMYPSWTDGRYNITFYDPIDEQNIAVRENVECGEIVIAPEAPVHEGKLFTGWSDDTWQTTKRYTTDLLVKAIYIDDTTGVGQVESGKTNVESNGKFLRNGQLYIQHGEELFNAQGARVQ